MRLTMDQHLNPEAHGLRECPHCHGYGSSLQDPESVDTCTQCNGHGLVPKVCPDCGEPTVLTSDCGEACPACDVVVADRALGSRR